MFNDNVHISFSPVASKLSEMLQRQVSSREVAADDSSWAQYSSPSSNATVYDLQQTVSIE
jgi:hypothetical protein